MDTDPRSHTAAQPNSSMRSPVDAVQPVLGGRTALIVLAAGQFAAVIAVVQRSSLGAVAAEALERFDIAASTLASFAMLQLLVYAVLQVPVGVLIDRYGSKRLIVVGSLLLALAQALLAVAESTPLAFAARVCLGIGDAMTFISVMRLIPSWFPPHRSGQITNATGQIYQLGFLISAVAFGQGLAMSGWTPTFLGAAGLSVLTALLAQIVLRDSPKGRPPRTPFADAFAVAGRNIRLAWEEPGTRLAFWLSFVTLFAPMTFGVMWGYPFLTMGQGLSPGTARGLMLVLGVAAIIHGPVLGMWMTRHPIYRSRIGLGVVGITAVLWTAVLVWPGPAPLALLVALLIVLPANSVSAVMAFDFARTFNPANRLGVAIGVVNVGGFASTLIAVLAIGIALQTAAPSGSTAYSLGAFQWALTVQYPLWAIGAIQVLRYRRRTIRKIGEHNPEGLDALRRGVHLPPPE